MLGKRLVYIIHSLGVGGAETLVTEYLLCLKRRGYDVKLIQLFDSETFLNAKLQEAYIDVETICKNRKGNNIIDKLIRIIDFNFFSKRRIEKSIRSYNPNVIHFHTNLEYMNAMDFDYSRVYYTFHTSVERSFNGSQSLKKAFLSICDKGAHIVAISNDIAKQVQDISENADITIIPNGIDINAIANMKIDRNEFCMNNNICTNSFILGHVGRFHPVKNHEKIIDVFNEVHKVNNNSVLLLVGGGEEERIQSIKKRAEEYGILKSVLFLGERNDAKSIISVMDCFILPSYTEGFSLVLGEAQAQGVRCVASIAVPNEIIINDNCFKLDINEDNKTWRDYILGDFLRDESSSLQYIDIETVIDKHIEVYRIGEVYNG